MTKPTGVDWISLRIRAAIGQRLLLGLAPALLAVVLVLALAYYGEIGRQAPEYVVAGAGALAILSLALTWQNTHYLQARLRRLGRTGDESSSERMVDDLDRIEEEVERLTTALAVTSREHADDKRRMDARLHEQATMLAATLRGVTAQVDEVRLPLHILLDARFGVLNENQEELLTSARAGADEIDAAVRRLSVVADADRDALTARLEPVSLNDIVRAILPMVRASADRRGTRVDVMLEPALSRVWANRAALAEAIALIATTVTERIGEGLALTIETRPSEHACAICIGPADVNLQEMPLVIVARRVLETQQATLQLVGQNLEIALPRAMADSSSHQKT